MSETGLNAHEATLARLFNSRLRSVIMPTDLTPGQITVLYGFIGFAALYFSDVYLPRAIQDPGVLAQLQALKGGMEVVLTAAVILVLTTRSRQAIQARNERLDTHRAERNVLHRVFRHNLRQDINVIMGYTELIRQDLHEETLVAHSEKVLDRIERVEEYQDKIVRIERVLEPPTTLRRLDLSALVRDHSAVLRLQDADDASISLDLPAESHVIAVPSISAALEEVLENAVEHNDADEPEVSITIEENSDELIDLVVTDNGPGISRYEREAIDGMREEELTHSSGLGLWLAKLACTVSGGDLDIPTQAGGGKVVFELPEAYERTIQRRLRSIRG